jgi:plastocyanin
MLMVIAMVGLATVGCSKKNDGGTVATQPSSSVTSAPSAEHPTIAGSTTDKGTADLTGKDETELEIDDNYFQPTFLKGAAGAKVKLELKNEGTRLHNFSVTGTSVDQNVAAGEDAAVDVTFPASGTVVFFCKFHRSSGMQGALFVAGAADAPAGGGASSSADPGPSLRY